MAPSPPDSDPCAARPIVTRAVCRRRVFACLAVVASTAVGCASYRFGNNTLYASNVRTIYVPVFQCDSYRTTPAIDVGERLTEAVCKEIEKRTPFKVVGSEAAADSVLTGRVVADTKRMVVESPTDQSRMVEMNYQVLVTWADRGGTVIAAGDVPLPAATVDVGQAASLVPEFGRSVASTQQEAIVKLAQQVVGLMEEPW
jgi:RNase P/RNase MRP subunit p29